MALITFNRWVEIFRRGKSLYTLADLSKLSGLSLAGVRKSAGRLAKKKILIPLKRELYANSFHPPSFEAAACFIYPPCYISCESVLFREGVLEQSPFDLTCVTLNKSKKIQTPLGEIDYQHIKEDLFFGYERENEAFWAVPEKALCDYVYLRKKRGQSIFLDEFNWKLLSMNKFKFFLRKYPQSVQKIFSPMK